MAVLDLAQSNDALLIQVDPGVTPMSTKPIQSNEPFFTRKANGEVETRFLTAPPEKKDVTIFPTQIAMLQLVSYVGEGGLKIMGFQDDGKPCYEGKSPSGHIWWDICDCVECQEDETFEEDHSRRKKKSSQQKFKERYEAGDSAVDLLGEPSRKFDYYVLYPKTKKQTPAYFSPSKENHDQNQKPRLIPYYQKVLPQISKCAFSRPPDMNMLAMDPDPLNPISLFLRTLTLEGSKEPFMLLVIKDSELDLSNLGLEEIFMTNTEPKVEEEDDVLHPKNPPPPPPPIFPPLPFIPEYQTMLTYSPTTYSKHLFTLDNVPPSR
ncbi:uncharacterized protein LOC136067262 [Quercus suber]|uniref:uncharacterized protein LOC136067262 n=1 Tax=Quercus suber TaxID=58331 RepID=UPI0032E04204